MFLWYIFNDKKKENLIFYCKVTGGAAQKIEGGAATLHFDQSFEC